MLIDITGYVTEAYGNNKFKIKITSDRIGSLSDIQVSKEVGVFIKSYYYPTDYYTEFKPTGESEYKKNKVNNCIFLSQVLRRGDEIKCSVFIVEGELRNGRETYTINSNRKDIETYADFTPLWLYPDPQFFKRLEVDSRESLKFRKQWFYTCVNREKYKKITGYTLYGYGDKKWINKNPIIIVPIIWWIQVKTTVSNLWERLTGQEKNKSTTINTVVTIIGIIVAIIGIIVAIWFR